MRLRDGTSVRSSLNRVWDARLGLAAQVLTLVSSFLPIGFNLSSALVFQVQVMAIVAVLISVVTGGISVRLPVMVDDSQASREVALATTLLALSSLCPIAMAALLRVLGISSFVLLLVAVAVLMWGQGAYVIAAAVATRAGKYEHLMRMRFGYAVASGGLILGACLSRSSGLVLVAASSVAFLAGVILVALPGFGNLLTAVSIFRIVTPSLFFGYLRQVSGLLAGFVFGGLATQAPAIMLGNLGQLALPWAVVTRVGAGVQTVSLQLVTPAVDIDVSRHLRAGAIGSARKVIVRGALTGLGLGSLTVLGSVGGVLWVGSSLDSGIAAWACWLVAVVGFAAANNVMGPTSRTLPMLGGVAKQLNWNMVKAVVAVASVVLLSPGMSLLALGATGVVLTAAYFVLVDRQLAKLNRLRSRRQTASAEVG